MELPTHSPLTFNSSKVSETLIGKRKQSIKSMGSQKRMIERANNRTGTSICKPPNKILKSSFSAIYKVQNNIQQSPPSAQHIQTRTASPPDYYRALGNSGLAKAFSSTDNLLGKEELLKRKSTDDGPICFCTSYTTRATGEKKIDETMDYAIQNLSEAGKALTNLGDNFEHDLKLMFMDIMGRVQRWVGVVQNRIQAAKADLESLRKEFITCISDKSTKDLELLALRRKLSQTEAYLAVQEEQRLENTPDVKRKMISTSVQAATDKYRIEERNKLQSRNSVTLVDIGCQSEDYREKAINREAQLEMELARLLEENDRIMQERAEYENKIHYALLKGVSSLNIEALKVLRYPPITCCTSCGLSPPHSSSPLAKQSNVVYGQGTLKSNVIPPQPVPRGLNDRSKKEKNKIQGRNLVENMNCCQPLSEHSLHCSGGNERSLENSMIFLLHHEFQPSIQSQYHPNGSLNYKESVCVSGKCRKTAKILAKDKVSCATESSSCHAASNDQCVRSKDGNCSAV